MNQPAERDAALHLRTMVDSVPALLAYWDVNLRCRFANRAYETWFGADPQGLIGRTLQELLGAELFALNEPYIRQVLAGSVQTFERLIPGPAGTRRHGLSTYVPAFEDGVVVGFTVHVADISQLKAAEAALRASEQRFRSLAECAPIGIFEADAMGKRTFTNARWQQIYGLTPQQAGTDVWLEKLHPADRPQVMALRQQALAQGQPFALTYRIQRAPDAVHTLHALGQPLLDEHGHQQGFVGTVEDITDRQQAEQRLHDSEALLDRTGRLVAVGGWQLDLRSGTLTWTDQTRRIHEVAPDHRPTLDAAIAFYAPEARPTLRAAVQAAIDHGQGWDLELPFVTATGQARWVRALGEAEFERGVVVRLVGALQDVTASRQQRLQLDRAQQARAASEQHALALDQLLRERSDMLDVLAHEVRQPLNNASAALQGAASAIGSVCALPVAERLERAQAVLATVMASIDNTLAVASLLARPEPIQRTDTDIDLTLDCAISDMPPAARARIRIERATHTRTASMDMSLMRLALRNLLANALSYSPADAPVTLRVSDSDEPLALVIEVVDAGSGLPPAFAARLFERGAHAPRLQPGANQGLGLGSYIVRRVMELHGGLAELTRNGPDGATIRLTVVQPGDDELAG